MDLISIFYRNRVLFLVLMSEEIVGFSWYKEEGVPTEISAEDHYQGTEQGNSTKGDQILRRMERQAVSSRKRLWKKGRLPYTIDKGFSEEMKVLIKESIDEFHKHTCIKFEEVEKYHYAIDIVKWERIECRASPGNLKPWSPYVFLNDVTCRKTGLILHELMHLIGFLHEHQRPDRDDYIRINKDNIRDRKENMVSFTKYSPKKVKILTPYSFDSIMHFTPFIFAKDLSSPTFTILKEGVEMVDHEESKTLPLVDVIRINMLYKCKIQLADLFLSLVISAGAILGN